MEIYVVKSGDTLYGIARRFFVSMDELIYANQLKNPAVLAVGQALVIPMYDISHTVLRGESLYSIARRYGVSVEAIRRANPTLGSSGRIYPGQVLTVPRGDSPRLGRITVDGYASNISESTLSQSLPYLTFLSPFSYRAGGDGSITPSFNVDVSLAARYDTAALMVVTNLKDSGGFSSDIAHRILTEQAAQDNFLKNVLATLCAGGYFGLSLDFEYVYPFDRGSFNQFLTRLADTLHENGYILISALAPKLSANQEGFLYAAHDYAHHGATADYVVLMTYECKILAHPLKPLQMKDLQSNIYITLFKKYVKYCIGQAHNVLNRARRDVVLCFHIHHSKGGSTMTATTASTSAYYFGDEATQFTYFRIPCQLITHPRFKHMSTDAKLLYGMLLDRMSLSLKNKWYDTDGRVYIYYTVDEICCNLTCGRDKAMKLLAELDTNKGVGLIERIKQGQGKPTRIYVLRFTMQELPPQQEAKPEPEPPVPLQEVVFTDLQQSDFPTQRGRDFRPQQVEKTYPNQTNNNQTDFIQTNQSIYPPTPSVRQMEIDRCEAREEIKERIDYELLLQELPYDDVESLLELIVDVTSSTAPTMRIGGEILPVYAVRQRFRQLDSEHIRYVCDCLRNTTTKVNNIWAYLLTALYNAPVTIGSYYSAAVRHDSG